MKQDDETTQLNSACATLAAQQGLNLTKGDIALLVVRQRTMQKRIAAFRARKMSYLPPVIDPSTALDWLDREASSERNTSE
jgi:hypothetical protein